MTKPISYSVTPDTPDADGLAAANDSSGSSVTLDGVLTEGGTFTAVDGLGHRIEITDTATVDQSGATFTITGTDANGTTITEAVTGPASTATVISTNYFKTVSSISVANGAGSGTVNVGTTDEVATPGFPMVFTSAINIGIGVVTTGTLDYTVQHCFDTYDQVDFSDVSWFSHATLVNQTASADGNYAFGLTGSRLVLNSYTGGATFKIMIVQGR